MTGDTHDKVWELIPWFVNGRLSEDDTATVKAHLAECERCRDEQHLQAKIHDAIRDEDSVVFPTEGSYRKLAERIDSSVGRGTRSRRVVALMAAALAVESVALVAWGAWTWLGNRSADARYVTLSSASEAPLSTSRGSLVRVVFADGVALGDVASLLRSADARVVDGPTERGVYTVELKGLPESSAERLQVLRGSALVRFAEPVMDGASNAR